MNTLLVPFDFSAYSTNALEYAIGLAAQIDASITIFHSFQTAVPIGEDSSPSLTYQQAMDGEEKGKIAAKIESFLQVYSDRCYANSTKPIQFDVLVRSGEFEDTFGRHVENKAYNIIVMGTEGAFGWDEVFGGSHTSRMVEQLNANFLVVPIESYFKGIKHIVYASNFDKSDTIVLSDIQDFNAFFEAKITCLHVTSKPEKADKEQERLQILEKVFAEDEMKIDFDIVFDEEVEDAIFSYARSVNTDLLAILPQYHGPMGEFFHDSMTKKMSMHTDLPLLIIKK